MFDPYIAILVVIILAFLFWKFRRISYLSDLPSDDISGHRLSGRVVSVSDGDGFMFFHVPLFRSSEYTPGAPCLRIRLAGIDAPETASFDTPAQPFSVRAKETLEDLVLDEMVTLKLLKVDQYDRILATCYLEDEDINVNKRMVELGMACVYKGKDAIYDGYKDELLRLEENAKQRKIGMWSRNDYVSPMQFKRQLRNRNQ